MLERADRFKNKALLIEDDADLHSSVALLDLVDLVIGADRGRDDVGVGLRVDDDPDCRFAIEPLERALLLDRVGDLRNGADPNDAAVLDGEDQVRDLLRICKKRIGADLIFLGTDLYDARREVEVFLLYAPDDLIERHAVSRELVCIGFDHEGARLILPDDDVGDAVNRGELIGELVGEEIAEITQRNVGIGYVEAHDRQRI